MGLLALAVLLLGAFIAFYERDLPSSTERARDADRWLSVEKERVESVTIDREGSRVRLERATTDGETGRWAVVEPVVGRADSERVDALLDALVRLDSRRTLEEPEPEALGLDPPRATVALGLGGYPTEPREIVLDFGAAVPASDARIAALRGASEAHVVSGRAFDQLRAPEGEWRARKLLESPRSEIERVSIEQGGRRVVLERRGEAFWIEEPLTDLAEASAIDGLLRELEGLSIREFVDAPSEDLASIGLEPPQMRIEVASSGRSHPLRIELGAATSSGAQRWGRCAGQLFLTESAVGSWLGRSVEDWQGRSWASFEAWRADRLEISWRGESRTVERAGADWTRDGDVISYAPISDLLTVVSEARASEVSAPEKWPDLGSPILRLSIRGSEGLAEDLTLYPSTDGSYPAQTELRSVVLRLPSEVVASIEAELGKVLDAPIIVDEASDSLPVSTEVAPATPSS